ncbi:MAG TPA: GTPase ObgE [Actinomycetota bacterium]|nr:GTPase ObgE [Actinomycetota bacterium]
MAFVDEAKIKVTSGAGGNGAVAWHREPYKPKGGPDGGDGGDGGSVILRADRSIGTLLEVRDHPHIKAERGGHGAGKRRHGAKGKDRIVLVPEGTIVYDEDGRVLADLAREGDQVVVAPGGRGGKGNARFATPTRRAPAFAQKGEPGVERSLRLELRLLADVGLVGFPNAGKSTLVSRISAARPKIADYPFTTLVPNLGVVRTGDVSFVVADIPGLIEGSHEGKGLGHRFLRHVSRAAVLVYFADLTADDRDPASDVDVLRRELTEFDPDLAARPSLIVASKVDAGRDRLPQVLESWPDALPISAITGEGIDELVGRLAVSVTKARAERPAPVGYVRHVVADDPIRVEREDGAWRVRGRRAERAVDTTDLDNDEAVARLQERLIKMGVERMLEEAGAREGDEVRIGKEAFDFEPESEGRGGEA